MSQGKQENRHISLLLILRWLITCFAAVNLVDALRTSKLFQGEPVDWLHSCILVLGYLTMGLAPWFAYVTAVISIVPLALVLVWGGGTGVEPLVIVPCLIAVAVKKPTWPLLFLAGAYSLWAVGLGFVMDEAIVGWFYFTIIVLAVIIGLVARHFLVDRVATKHRLVELEKENRRIRSDERQRLARELHDGTAHDLSIISLQVMAHGQSDDPDELRAALSTTDQASRSAVANLRTLVDVLRNELDDDENVVSRSPTDDRIVQHIDQTIDSVASTLRDNGFRPLIRIDPIPVDLESSLHTTVCRLVTEATTNILRYAEPCSTCLILVLIHPTDVYMRVSSPRATKQNTDLAWQSNKFGLRGLKERVDLSGGTFTAGPEDGDWVVEATLPRLRRA